ncbi:MAG: lipase family protein [Acidimicrobiia bacterium]
MGRIRLRATVATFAVVAAGAAAALPVGAAGVAGAAEKPSPTTTTVLGDNPAAGAFYQPPNPLPKARPGTIIRKQALTDAPAGSRGWRVLYHSTGLNGEDIAVSGMIFAPAADAPAPTTAAGAPAAVTRGRTIVTWAHPTTGVADQCAPSVLPDGPATIAGLQSFLDAGFVVAATDYQGLGTPGVHPYLVGISEGRGTLDAARAARNLKATNAGKRVFTWGHSQGGQGSLFAGELAPTYAPELQLMGAAAAAPAGELAKVFHLDENTVDGIALGGWAMNAYDQVYKAKFPKMSIDQMITASGQAALPQLIPLCDAITADEVKILGIAEPLIGSFYATTDPGAVPPWGELLLANRPGNQRTKAPVYVAQDTADVVVPAVTTDGLVQDLCTKGDTVDYDVFPGLSHTEIGFASAPNALAWMQAILAGQAAPDTCT